jgi:uncharacterized membrane protein YfcA
MKKSIKGIIAWILLGFAAFAALLPLHSGFFTQVFASYIEIPGTIAMVYYLIYKRDYSLRFVAVYALLVVIVGVGIWTASGVYQSGIQSLRAIPIMTLVGLGILAGCWMTTKRAVEKNYVSV